MVSRNAPCALISVKPVSGQCDKQISLTNVSDSDRLRHASLENVPVYGDKGARTCKHGSSGGLGEHVCRGWDVN